MPAFDKNSVLVNHAYSINVKADDDTGPALLSCPRCGHKMERKHRTMCLSCKRMIPPVESRQRWQSPTRDPYFEQVNPAEQAVKAISFKLMKKDHYAILRSARQALFAIGTLSLFFYGLPLFGRQMLGERQYTKVVAEMAYLVPDYHSIRTIASAPFQVPK